MYYIETGSPVDKRCQSFRVIGQPSVRFQTARVSSTLRLAVQDPVTFDLMGDARPVLEAVVDRPHREML